MPPKRLFFTAATPKTRQKWQKARPQHLKTFIFRLLPRTALFDLIFSTNRISNRFAPLSPQLA
jgi:hypothetical protein